MISLRTLFSCRSDRRSRRRSQQLWSSAQPAQALETRCLLAGNVLVSLNAAGDLLLTGDDSANVVDVAVINGDVVVRGRENTTINGADAVFTAATGSTSFSDNLFASLGSGDDVLFVENVMFGGSVSVDAGNGGDSVGFDGATVRGSLSLNTGSGTNTVNIEGTRVSGNLTVHGGNDADTVRIAESTIGGDLKLRTGRQDDAVVLDTVTIGDDLLAFTGAGNDDLVVTDSFVADRLKAVTRRGNDFVLFDGTAVTGRAVVRTGRETDHVIAENSSQFGSLIVNTGVGRDTAQIDASTVTNRRRKIRRSEDAAISAADRDRELNDATSGALTRAAAADDFFDALTTAPLSLSVDTSANTTVESTDGLLITNDSTFELAVTTQPGATVSVDADGDGQFDDATATADGSGLANLTVTLTHDSNNNGANTLTVQASNAQGDAPLTEDIDVHFAVGTVVRFDSSLGSWDVELLDDDAPNTVGIFLDDLGRYDETIVHRSPATQFVQGGGFSVNGTVVSDAPDFPPPPNEFNVANPSNSNVRGTISTAQIPGNINTFSGEWFFNTIDNTGLDSVPHVPFGRVIGNGMDVVDAIDALPDFDVSNLLTGSTSNLRDAPLRNYTAGTTPTPANFVTINSITEILAPAGSENTFGVVENSVADTVVGTVTPQTVTGDLIFEFDAPAIPAQLNLNADDHLEGEANAPVVVIEYLSLACPACAAAHPDVEQLLADNAGDVVIVRRHQPLDTANGGGFAHSFEAALAAEAAGRQGMFEEMVDALFSRQSEFSNSVTDAAAQAVFEDIAVNTLGLNLTQFRADMDDQDLADRINRDIADAAAVGATGTPSFFVNGSAVNGTPQTSDVQGALQQLDPTFLLDRRTGELSVFNAADLNHAVNPNFTLDINVSNGATEAVQVMVDVIDTF